MKQRALVSAFTVALACLAATGESRAAGPGSQVLRGSQISEEQVFGQRIAAVPVQLEGSTGSPEGDARLLEQVREVAAAAEDTPLQRFVLDGLMQRIRSLAGVQSASVATFSSVPAGRVVLVIQVVASASTPPPAKGAAGALVAGSGEGLPLLYKDDRALFKTVLNGGVGAYVTSNPFFGYGNLFTQGNKAARDPAGPGTTAWVEGYIEPGIGGISQLGQLPLYAYGDVTYLVSASSGQDIYDSGFRHHGAFEQAYAGMLADLPGKGNTLNVSAGRQIYQLRQGFLISKIPGSTNLGQLGATWLGPRLAFDRTAVASLKYGAFTAEGVGLEPTEFPGMGTQTRILAGTAGYNDGETIDAALTYLEVPRSTRPYLAPDGSRLTTREGLRTISPSLWLTKLFGVEGLWFKGEYAHQSHDRIDMSAYAYALWPGYRAEKLPWKPGFSYRYTVFSGDNPNTKTYERYDPLLSGGQNNYVPGMLLSSVLVNSNLRSHRFSLTANPTQQSALTLEYTIHRAIELNNRGGIGPTQQLSSKALAQEVDLFANVYFGKTAYLQAVLAAALPGSAIKQAVGGSAKNWYAAQLSLYFFY